MTTGVYQIRNVINDKLYIGSASRLGGFTERWREHRKELRGNRHCNQHLQNAWNKHGETSFVFEVIELCSAILCIEREQYYLDILQPAYNICQVAGSSLGVKRSKTTRAKQSKLKIGNQNRLGCKHSQVTKTKIANAVRGNQNMLGKKHSQDTKTQISKARKGKLLGQDNHSVKLTKEKVHQIRILIIEGVKQNVIAVKFGVTPTTITNIKTRKAWSHI